MVPLATYLVTVSVKVVSSVVSTAGLESGVCEIVPLKVDTDAGEEGNDGAVAVAAGGVVPSIDVVLGIVFSGGVDGITDDSGRVEGGDEVGRGQSCH